MVLKYSPINPQERIILELICSISMVSCAVVIVTVSYVPDQSYKVFCQIARCIAISDFMQASALVFGTGRRGIICQYQAFTSNCFQLCTFFWICVLSHFLLRIVIWNHRVTLTYYHHVICWGLGIILTLIPLSTLTYGYMDDNHSHYAQFCQFGHNSTSQLWFFFCYTLIQYAWGAFIILEFAIMLYRIRTAQLTLNVLKYTLYPSIMFICLGLVWLIPGNQFVHATIEMSSQGFLTSVAFFFIERSALQELTTCCHNVVLLPHFAIDGEEDDSSDEVVRIETSPSTERMEEIALEINGSDKQLEEPK